MSARTTQRYDVIVLGLGGMGSAAAAHLAARGATVLGLEQFTPAHDRGSSHGESRMIRQAYFEGAEYVPLLLRAYELWDDLDREDPGVFRRTGGLMIGKSGSPTVEGSAAAARAHGLAHDLLDATAIRERFPQFRPGDDDVALYEAAAGYVRPERAVSLQLRRAERAGAELHFEEPAVDLTADDGGVTVTTARGTYRADRLVVTAGAWAPRVLAELDLPLVVERQVLYWFRTAAPQLFGPDRFPVFIWEQPDALQLYAFPLLDGGDEFKVSFFRRGGPTDPDELDREIHDDEVAAVADALRARVPDAAGEFVRGVACMYTTTPDEDFVIATHPGHPNVVVAAGFSGHGFKFTPVVGEIVADLATTGTTAHPIGLFDPARFVDPAQFARR
ncbi:N-methyl-L-tryptophan oxidase [Jatrophihabitans sp. YIM 134969]